MRNNRLLYQLILIVFCLMLLIIIGTLYETNIIRSFVFPIILCLFSLAMVVALRAASRNSDSRATHGNDGSSETPTSNRVSRRLSLLWNVLSWGLSILGYIVFVGIFVSPWFEQHLDTMIETRDQVQATVHSCELLRDGRARDHAIVCAFSYEYKGETYTATSKSWSTESPFVTEASLDRVLAEQLAGIYRTASVDPSYPKNARLIDDRWLDAPGLWLWFVLTVAGLLGLSLLIPTGYKRADMSYDSVSGELVDINSKRQNRVRLRAALQTFAIVIALFGGVYALSNRVQNMASLAGMSGLQAVPAKLTDCEHHYHGSTKGHDQIDCNVRYRFDGQSFQGQAESIDFRLFPTDARMDAGVKRLNEQENGVVAHVDPRHPSYAIAFISNAWWVPYSYGIFELMLLGVWLPVALFFLAKNWRVGLALGKRIP